MMKMKWSAFCVAFLVALEAVFGGALLPRAHAEDAASLTHDGRSLIHAGKLKEAEIALRKAAALQGQSLESLYELARVTFATGDYRKSRAACKPLSDKSPDAALTNVCMARAFLVWRRAARAEEYLDAASAKDGSDHEVLLARGDMMRVQGNTSASKDAYQQLLGLDADNADAYYGLGLVALITPDLDAARKAFREALKREPQWPDAQFELGQLIDGPEALTLLEQAVAARPSWPEAQLALGQAKLRAGDLVGAENLFRAVLKASPQNPLAHARLGMLLEAKHDYALAEPELKKGLEGVPNDSAAALSLARVYAGTDRAEEAFDQFRAASGLGSPLALVEAGVFALKLSRNSLAQAFLEKAVERSPSSAEAQARYADVLLLRGEKAQAKEHYKLALSGEGTIDRKDIERRLAALN